MEDDKSKQPSVNVSEVSEEELGLHQRPRLHRNASAQTVLQTDDWWLWELCGILVSLVALAGIGGLLSVLDNRPQPTWAVTSPARKIGGKEIPAVTVAVSPNSILSLLSTIGRICVLIPITKGLAQLKWVWFAEKERQLSDFEAFDNARTVTGSLFLVWKLKFRHLAVVGAAAVLLALGFDPFVQNLLSYYPKNVLDTSVPALLPRANKYIGANIFTTLNTEMKAAIVAGFSAAPNFDIPDYTCASGNCTWKDTTTLGVCSRCSDVSSLLLRQCNSTGMTVSGPMQQCRFSLPNGFHLNAHPDSSSNYVANSTDGLTSTFQPLVYANYSDPIARMWSIFGDGQDLEGYTTWIKPKTKVYATECALIPCVQLIDSSVGSSLNALGSGVTTSFKYRVTAEYDTYKHNYSQTALSVNIDNTAGAWLQPNNDVFGNETYELSLASAGQMTKFLSATVPGTVRNRYYTPIFTSSTRSHLPGHRGSLYVGGAPEYSLPKSPSTETNADTEAGSYPESLFLQNVFTADVSKICVSSGLKSISESLRFQCVIENMAKAMSVSIRNGRVHTTPGSAFSIKSESHGSTMVSKTYIAVTWYWLLLPILLWVLALIMLVGTVWKTRKAGVRTWRTSTLAPLFLGLGIADEQKHKVEQLPMTADGLQKKAEEIKVQLHLTQQEMKLVGG